MNDIYKGATSLALLLFVSYAASFGARSFWFLDLFRHFVLQYWIAAAILSLFFLFKKSKKLFILCSLILCSTSYELFSNLDLVTRNLTTSETQHFKIVTYNRKYTMNNHDDMISWLKTEDPDVIIIQEARTSHIEAINSISDLYPHQILEPRQNAFGTILVSKYPFVGFDVVETKRYALNNFYIRALISLTKNKDVTIYTAHPPPPMVQVVAKQRNEDIRTIASAITQDNQNRIIFAGDWNVTPYSPHFHNLIETTQLKNQYTSFFMVHTWPSPFILPIFQIPIDHILHKGDLRLVDKRRGPAMGSDHYPLISTFALQ